MVRPKKNNPCYSSVRLYPRFTVYTSSWSRYLGTDRSLSYTVCTLHVYCRLCFHAWDMYRKAFDGWDLWDTALPTHRLVSAGTGSRQWYTMTINSYLSYEVNMGALTGDIDLYRLARGLLKSLPYSRDSPDASRFASRSVQATSAWSMKAQRARSASAM